MKKKKPFVSGESTIQRLLKNPPVQFYYEQNKAKTKIDHKVKTNLKGWKFSSPSAKEAAEIRRGVSDMKSGKVKTISSQNLIKHLKNS